jgi:hypothetical protein
MIVEWHLFDVSPVLANLILASRASLILTVRKEAQPSACRPLCHSHALLYHIPRTKTPEIIARSFSSILSSPPSNIHVAYRTYRYKVTGFPVGHFCAKRARTDESPSQYIEVEALRSRLPIYSSYDRDIELQRRNTTQHNNDLASSTHDPRRGPLRYCIEA